MKRLVLLCIMATLLAIATHAQTQLHILKAFDGPYRTAPWATETVVTGKQLKPYGLTMYHGLTVTDPAAIANLQQLMGQDSPKAINREESIKGGVINYGFYEFDRTASGQNRFVFFFSNKSKAKAIYLEGLTDIESIKKLIKK